MAQDFPLSLQQLLPIMDVIGYANKYLKRVRICLLQCPFRYGGHLSMCIMT
jgi:hypothetical protein